MACGSDCPPFIFCWIKNICSIKKNQLQVVVVFWMCPPHSHHTKERQLLLLLLLSAVCKKLVLLPVMSSGWPKACSCFLRSVTRTFHQTHVLWKMLNIGKSVPGHPGQSFAYASLPSCSFPSWINLVRCSDWFGSFILYWLNYVYMLLRQHAVSLWYHTSRVRHHLHLLEFGMSGHASFLFPLVTAEDFLLKLSDSCLALLAVEIVCL